MRKKNHHLLKTPIPQHRVYERQVTAFRALPFHTFNLYPETGGLITSFQFSAEIVGCTDPWDAMAEHHVQGASYRSGAKSSSGDCSWSIPGKTKSLGHHLFPWVCWGRVRQPAKIPGCHRNRNTTAKQREEIFNCQHRKIDCLGFPPHV